tara:strand:+ start:3662 stop:3775 length:114 start_codon:yes stop_codon:yes gene_type:complete
MADVFLTAKDQIFLLGVITTEIAVPITRRIMVIIFNF